MSTKTRPTPEFIELLKQSGSSDKSVAMAAQREIAKALDMLKVTMLWLILTASQARLISC